VGRPLPDHVERVTQTKRLPTHSHDRFGPALALPGCLLLVSVAVVLSQASRKPTPLETRIANPTAQDKQSESRHCGRHKTKGKRAYPPQEPHRDAGIKCNPEMDWMAPFIVILRKISSGGGLAWDIIGEG
jgi:hypothetical protein